MEEFKMPKYPYFKALKEEKRRKVSVEYTIRNYNELSKVIKMLKNMTKNKEIAEINFKINVDYYIDKEY